MSSWELTKWSPTAESVIANPNGKTASHRIFIRETRRGEAAHLAQLVVISGFSLWTPWPWALVILAWALASNLPCLALQRYNRLRFLKHIPET